MGVEGKCSNEDRDRVQTRPGRVTVGKQPKILLMVQVLLPRTLSTGTSRVAFSSSCSLKSCTSLMFFFTCL